MKKKENKKDKITLKMLWAHPFYNSLIKMGAWFLFFLILYIFLVVGRTPRTINNENHNEVKDVKVSYIDMKKKIINSELSIIYNISSYTVTGLINNNILTGTLEDSDGNLVKIKYDGENIYRIKKDEEVIDNDLIQNIKAEYLLPSNIVSLIDNPKVIGIKSADELTYSYDIDGVAISVYLNENSIEKTIILDNEITYDLEYKEVVNEK